MEILQAPLEVGRPVEFSSGEAKVCMLFFFFTFLAARKYIWPMNQGVYK